MSNKSVFFVLLALCIAASVHAQAPGMPGIPGFPGIDKGKCFSTIQDIPGCFFEIRQSIFSGHFSIIGPACCKACQDAEANCVPKLPSGPLFPPLLTQQCSPKAGSPATPSAPITSGPLTTSGPPATPGTGCPN